MLCHLPIATPVCVDVDALLIALLAIVSRVLQRTQRAGLLRALPDHPAGPAGRLRPHFPGEPAESPAFDSDP